jgi:hypothetical protein
VTAVTAKNREVTPTQSTNEHPAKPGGQKGDHAMPRIIGPTILAIGIVCAPVIFAGMPGDAAHSQVRALKGDRLDVKPVRIETPARIETPVRVVGPTRVAALE